MADVDKAIGSNWRIFILCAVLLVLKGLWRVFLPAHEYGSSATVWLSVGVDALLVIGLVGLYRQLSGIMPPEDGRRGMMTLLFWPALIAGVVIFLIRFSSKEGWWTGHLRYVLE